MRDHALEVAQHQHTYRVLRRLRAKRVALLKSMLAQGFIPVYGDDVDNGQFNFEDLMQADLMQFDPGPNGGYSRWPIYTGTAPVFDWEQQKLIHNGERVYGGW